MAEYIKKEEIEQKIQDGLNNLVLGHDAIEILGMIYEMPSADVAPVVHTRWAHLGGDEWCCPVCGFVITTEGSWDKPTKKYCEDCGAKMDGGDNHEVD